jgi:hypothetical protein
VEEKIFHTFRGTKKARLNWKPVAVAVKGSSFAGKIPQVAFDDCNLRVRTSSIQDE